MNQTLYIPDLVGAVVEKVSNTFASRPTNPFSVYYEKGYHEDVLKILIYKDQDPTKPKKYPFIWLVTPNVVEDDVVIGLGSTELHLVIVQDSSNEYLVDERRDTTIKPLLLPIYDEFKKQMKKASNVFITDGTKPKWQVIHYAKADADGKNLFNDFVDVVDIRWNLKVHSKKIC